MAVYEVVFRGQVTTEPMVSVLHYDIVGSTNFQALADRISVLMIPALRDLLSPSASYAGITTREDIPGGVGVAHNFTAGPVVGTNAQTDVWGLVAVNVRKQTAGGVRPAQGRIYQGGIPATAITAAGDIDVGYRLDLLAAWSLLRVIDFDTTGVASMVIKASNPTAPNTVPYNPVTAFSVLGRPTKQSRRNWST